MIDDTQLEHWKTKVEASEILKMLGEDDQSAGRPKANPKADAAESWTEGAAGVQSGRHRGAPR